MVRPVKVGNRWGFLDPAKGIVAQPRYEEAYEFREGLAAVCTGGQPGLPGQVGANWGFVDESGALAIEARFDDARSFSEGLAAVNLGARVEYTTREDAYYSIGGKWGYIDRTGAWVIEPCFDFAGPFGNGLALAGGERHRSYIDREGKTRIEGPFDYGYEFCEGRASVEVNRKWGFIDLDGKWIAPPEWRLTHSYSEGLADALRGSDYAFYYLDLNGKPAFRAPENTVEVHAFSEGRAKVKLGEIGKFNDGSGSYARYTPGGFGFVDRAGNWAVPPEYEDVGSYSEGLAAAQVKMKHGSKYGYLAPDGRWAIAPKFDSAGAFRGGYALVAEGSVWALADRCGDVVWRAL